VFVPGQIWTYKSRAGEEHSRVVICCVETDQRLGEIVHIHVRGLNIPNPSSRSGKNDTIGHMPYAARALGDSLVSIEASAAQLPDFRDGYDQWRAAFDLGKAGIWTAPLADAIGGIEGAFQK